MSVPREFLMSLSNAQLVELFLESQKSYTEQVAAAQHWHQEATRLGKLLENEQQLVHGAQKIALVAMNKIPGRTQGRNVRALTSGKDVKSGGSSEVKIDESK
jgi:hypothetical protein